MQQELDAYQFKSQTFYVFIFAIALAKERKKERIKSSFVTQL